MCITGSIFPFWRKVSLLCNAHQRSSTSTWTDTHWGTTWLLEGILSCCCHNGTQQHGQSQPLDGLATHRAVACTIRRYGGGRRKHALQRQQQGKKQRQSNLVVAKVVVEKWLMPMRPGCAGRTPLLSNFLIIMLSMHADNISAAAATVHIDRHTAAR